MLGNTVLRIVLVNCSILDSLVHRQLDDIPGVVPYKKKNWCIEFMEKYNKDLNVKIAEDCPKCEKAFSCTQVGRVLGVQFDTRRLCWNYPDEKKQKTLNSISLAVSTKVIGLLNMQKLMGRLNDIALMCPFMKTFKAQLNSKLAILQAFPESSVILDDQSLKDLYVWAGLLLDREGWLPICPRPCAPPLSSLTFTSDAAGFNKNSDATKKIGCSSIGLDLKEEICFAAQIFWPKNFVMKTELGCMTTTLELIGLLMPFLMIPKLLAGKHVVLKVDNIGCYYAWQNKSVKNEVSASILTRALVLISAYLQCQVHVVHLPRMSTWDACLADRMSREATTGCNDRNLLSSFGNLMCPNVLTQWLQNPTQDWNLAMILLKHVTNTCEET
jgi:hypothetical protein